MADEQHLDLAELCRQADVTPRTVRFYIAQGLLTGPAGRGPGSRYDQSHLTRLRLIKSLQAHHLPLAEIRKALEQLDAEAQEAGAAPAAEAGYAGAASLSRTEQADEGQLAPHESLLPPSSSPAPAPLDTPAPDQQMTTFAADQPPAPAGSALEYIRSVLAPRSAEQMVQLAIQAEPEAAAPGRAQQRAPRASSPQHHADQRRRHQQWGKPSRSQWERISLSPDVELHIRRPLSPKDQKAVARLTEFAAGLFEEGSS